MSPDKRRHRGAHLEDARLFEAARLASLRVAVSELSWLLSRGYQTKSALKLVGDRHNLKERQRLAVARAACAEENCVRRRTRRVGEFEVAGEGLIVDGFNLVAVTSDSNVLDGVSRWLNLGRMIVERHIERPWVIDLAGDDEA